MLNFSTKFVGLIIITHDGPLTNGIRKSSYSELIQSVFINWVDFSIHPIWFYIYCKMPICVLHVWQGTSYLFFKLSVINVLITCMCYIFALFPSHSVIYLESQILILV